MAIIAIITVEHVFVDIPPTPLSLSSGCVSALRVDMKRADVGEVCEEPPFCSEQKNVCLFPENEWERFEQD